MKWRDSYSLTGIQLEFEGGLKSERIAANGGNFLNERRVDLKGLQITSITSRVDGPTIRTLTFNHKGGQLKIFDSGKKRGSNKRQEIDEGYGIVGVYG